MNKEMKKVFQESIKDVGKFRISKLHITAALNVKIATEAGYDPKGAIKFLEKLGKIPKSEQEYEFFSTHPSASNRIKKLEDRFYEFQYIYDQLPKAPTPPAPVKKRAVKESNQSIRDRYKNASPMIRYAVDEFLKGLDED